jgi:hypothetical protein
MLTSTRAPRASASPFPARLVAIPLAAVALLIGGVLSIAVIAGATPPGCGGEPVGALNAKVPARLVPLYTGAASRFGLGARGPSVLAAINWVESGFGANTGPSSAGAEGPMQFLPATFATYGVDGDQNGVRDIDNPADAIYTAANYLHASGAPGVWHAAIYAYNHSDTYVADVEATAARFAVAGSTKPAEPCLAAAPNDAVARMLAEAARLSALRPHTEYVWGGSHGSSPTPPNGPFDCSSAVSHLLQVGGFENPTMDTTALVRWGLPGPGRYVTIFVKPYGPEAHTFIEFMPGITPPTQRYWGTSGIAAPGKGPGFITQEDFSAGYLAGFEQRHPPGL